MATNKIKDVKRVRAHEPRKDEFVSADNIRVSRGNKICLETFKKRKDSDGTITVITKRIYKRPTKTNVRKVEEAGYMVKV